MVAVHHLEFSKFRLFCHLTSVGMAFCFNMQNFTKIGKSATSYGQKKIF